jgi:flagellar basal-body rod protein FlgB
MCEMGLTDLPIFNLLQQRMNWLNDRQNLLARNIANSSTPGFVPQDLKETDFAATVKEASGGGMRTTNARHLQGQPSANGSFKASARRIRNRRRTATPWCSKSR